MTDLWAEASIDHDAMAREASLARAEAELGSIMPFFFASRSRGEYAHRRALASDRLLAIALQTGLQPDEMYAMADRHMELYIEAMMRQALPEGVDPLDQVMQGAEGGFGSGPERPDQHSEGPDFSGGYSEVPAGAPGGPPPNVVTPDFSGPPQAQQAVAMRRRADMSSGANLPAGMSQQDLQPDGTQAGGGLPGPAAAPPPSGMDPVAQQVTAVTASIRAANPALPEQECRRVARQVVGRYLRKADLDSSVISDDRSGGGGGGGGNGSGGGGGGVIPHMLEGQGLRSMLPSAGSGLADAAELAAL